MNKDEWISIHEKLPDCNDKFGDSEHYLCFTDYQPPFVAWYNNKANKWTVSHHYARSESASVHYWHPNAIPDLPHNDISWDNTIDIQ